MIVRISRAKSGISDYLEKGVRSDSEYTRTEKDNVIPIFGDLETFRQTERYLNKYKNYKDNYIHITISYSKEDMILMDNMSDDEVKAMKKDIVLTYIKHHTSGYDINNEVIAYSETHQPKIKFEHNKKRFEHEHIAIALYNPLSDTKLQTTFANNSFIDDTLQTFINKKYGLSHPRSDEHKRKQREYVSNDGLIKKEWTKRLKDLKDSDELLDVLKNEYNYKENIDFKITGSKSFRYVKLIKKGKNKRGLTDINLNNKELLHLVIKNDKKFISSKDKDIKDLEDILTSYYEKRVKQIDKRRSKSSKAAIKNIYNSNNAKTNQYSFSNNLSYQQKIFYKHYKHMIEKKMKGYYIDTKEDNKTKFINKKKNINIEDINDKIVSHTNDTNNLQERISVMLSLAAAKKWNITELTINGSDEFVQEAERQIAIIIQEQSKKNLSITDAEAVHEKINKRSISITQQYKHEKNEQKAQDEANNDVSLSDLKKSLDAHAVLQYAIDKYKLNANDYAITKDNKINNLNNRQKPKNVIDFLQKEIHIKTSEAITICKNIYNNQQSNINSNQQESENNVMSMKLSICKDTNINALKKWKQVEVNNYSELASYMKQYAYSQAIFDNNYRKADNANDFNNVLIYDIDNDKDTPQLTINEAKQLLEKHNISAMILPSKSNNIDKNGHIAERYRIMIPTSQSISIFDKETYREFQKITSKALKIDKYVDNKALNDKARFYYKSPITAEPIIIKSNRVMNIENLQKRAVSNIKERDVQKQAELKKINELKANLSQYKETNKVISSDNLTFADFDKINELNIKQLINHFEKDNNNYNEGSYDMIKTNNAKYSILDNNIAHDFKNDITYNSLTYLQHKLNTTNLNNIARELENISNDKYIKININKVKEVVQQARSEAINDKTFEDFIKKSFNVKFCKFDKTSIRIADQDISFENIDIQKHDIIKDFQMNRALKDFDTEAYIKDSTVLFEEEKMKEKQQNKQKSTIRTLK